MREILREFCERTDNEKWTGVSTAYRNGCKSRLLGLPCNYLRRSDFQEAWKRGYTAMHEYLKAGGEIHRLPDGAVVVQATSQ